MNLDKKKKMIIGGVLLVVLVLTGWMFFGRNQKAPINEEEIVEDGVIPTIDSSVKIDLTALAGKKEVLLTIKNIPKNTTGIEYILSYETVEGGLQGVNSTAEIDGSSFEKKITLGTCSSGTCVYHNIKENIKVELIFKSDIGDRYFTKEYEI
ncbi:MAG: hypothetical protein Q7J11_00190 [Candidatus Roizmanbacteria bacterium]|nr:hypothetical protein [Candidatus Roizmanbacteria bacterium]